MAKSTIKLNLKATRIFQDKMLYPDGHIVEMVIWQLPNPDPERPHGLKYSLFYGNSSERIVAYDNERGKGDHKHTNGVETAYRFTSVSALVADFLNDVAISRGEQ